MLLPDSLALYGFFEILGLQEGRLILAPTNGQLLRVLNTATVPYPEGINFCFFLKNEHSCCHLIYLPKIRTYPAVPIASMSGI